MNSSSPTPAVAQKPSFREAFRFWLKLGFISFGGPAGQIAIMHTELVERRKWISESRFLHALNYCMLLPGPEAQQLATYAGWLLHGTWGGIVAGTLFVLPSAILLWLLSYLYVTFGNIGWVAALFEGWKPAVLAIIVAATWRIGSRALKHPALWGIAACAFVGIYFLRIPFPAIVFAALAFGYVTSRSASHWFQVPVAHAPSAEPAEAMDLHAEARRQPTLARAFKVVAVCGVLWWLPVLLVGLWLGWQSTLAREGVFFSKAAMMTFGGAYAVLPYVSQQAVEKYDWLEPHQMIDGLGFAETTPGPLIMVLQFVGFLGAWNHPGSLSPLVAATLGAAITTWTTFLPCFLWIFLGAPYIERLRANLRLSAAMTAVTAAVVGVILNLAVWFAGEVFWSSKLGVDWYGVIVASVAFIGLTRWKWGIIPVVLGAGLLGVVRYLWF